MPERPSTAVPRPVGLPPVPLSALDAVARGGVLRGADVALHGVTATSSQVCAGDLFVAIPGRQVHGARFASDAVAAGAVAVLTDGAGVGLLPAGVPALVVPDVRDAVGDIAAQVYRRPSRSLRVLGITGTSGKTTTSFMVRAGLVAAGRTTGLVGTVATMIGDEALKTDFTTPEAPDMQALLAVMLERGVTDVVMEVSSHALRMGRVGGIGFDVAAFTNLSEDHLEFHDGMEDYFAAKASLFDARTNRPVVVVDDDWGRRLARMVTGAATVATGPGAEDTGATWRAQDVTERPDGTSGFTVLGPDVQVVTGCAIPGRYNVANVVLALAMLHEIGVDPAGVAPAVAAAVVPGRMERIDEGQPYLAVVDYSHKPAAVDGALRALRPLTAGRLIVVLGCGGDRDPYKRPHMGEIAARGADLLVATDDNPRSEDPAAIRRAMLDGAMALPDGQRGEVIEVGDRAEAIGYAVRAACPGDTVLVAGKGHETGQEIAGRVHPFDDRDVLRAAITGDRR